VIAMSLGALLVAGYSAGASLCFADVASQSQTFMNARFQASGEGLPFEAIQYRNFEDYIMQTRERLKRHKVYLDPSRIMPDLDASTPFERSPAGHCEPAADGRPGRGILLLHGLSDTPLAMADLADAFAERCFLVRVLLLPGHGTRAGDLLDVHRNDWLNATRFGLETLKRDADTVFVGGFSLGGLLSVHAVLEGAELAGAFIFSPALVLADAWLIRQAVWLRHVLAWVDRDSQDDYARYEAMPMNAMAETYLLTRELKQLLETQEVAVPVFMAQSADDPVIDVAANQKYFRKRFAHPGSRLLVYRRNLQEIEEPDSRVRYFSSFLPAQRIASFSHLSLHIAPTHPHYGVAGDYRSCGQGSGERSPDAVSRCLQALRPWYGEVYRDIPATVPDPESMARLTFNPRFDGMFDQVDDFIADNSL